MRDAAIEAFTKIQNEKDNPKWDRIYKALKQAAVSGRNTGIFKVEEADIVPFYKKGIKSGD